MQKRALLPLDLAFHAFHVVFYHNLLLILSATEKGGIGAEKRKGKKKEKGKRFRRPLWSRSLRTRRGLQGSLRTAHPRSARISRACLSIPARSGGKLRWGCRQSRSPGKPALPCQSRWAPAGGAHSGSCQWCRSPLQE